MTTKDMTDVYNYMMNKNGTETEILKRQIMNRRAFVPSPKRIIVNEDSKVTVVMWDDGTKTIVKCSEADMYDPYAAYCAAFAKKCYGTNSKLKKTIEKLTVYQEKKKKDKTAAPMLPSMEEAAKNFNDVVKRFYGTD